MWWGNRAALRFWGSQNLEDLVNRDFSTDSDMVRQRLRHVVDYTPSGSYASDTWTLYPVGGPQTVVLTMTPILVGDGEDAVIIEIQPAPGIEGGSESLRILEAARNTPLMVSTVALDGSVLSGNPASIDTYGSHQQSLDDSISRLADRVADPSIVPAMLAVGQDHGAFSRDIEVLTARGVRWHHVNVRRGRDPLNGEPVLVVTEEDITTRVSASQQLSQLNRILEERVRRRTAELEEKSIRLRAMMTEAQEARRHAEEATRAKSSFLANMSHELRTPLNAVLGFSEVMIEEMFGGLPARYREYADNIHNSATHLLKLINDLLDLSKIEAGKVSLEETESVLEDIVKDAVRYVRANLDKKLCAIVIQIPDTMPKIRLDPVRFRQVLLNVLSNAGKFSHEGAQIVVSAEINPAGCCIQVSDNGPGIPTEKIPTVLKAYERGDTGLSLKQEGAGLGLPIAKALMEQHGGRLDLSSVLGEGTTVRLNLPPKRLVI